MNNNKITLKIANYLLFISLVILSINWISSSKNISSSGNISSSVNISPTNNIPTSTENASGKKINNLTTHSNFSFIISLEHPEYLEAEEVWIKIEIKNNGKTIDSLPAFDEIEMLESLIIKDANGVVLPYHGMTGTTLGTTFVKFKPNETQTIETELIDVYANISENLPENKTTFSYSNYFAHGIYSVQLKYFVSNETQPQFSNQIELKVTKPQGEEIQALSDLREIYALTDISNENKLIKIHNYDDFINKYPVSKYMDQAFAWSVRTRGLTGVDYNINFTDKILRYIQNRPDTYQAKYSLWNLVDATIKFGEGKSKAIEILKRLQNDYPGTKISIAAENKLNDKQIKQEYKK